MTSKWDYEPGLPPPSYNSLFNNEKSQNGLIFVDFFPDVIKPEGIFKMPIWNEFRSLVDRANDWLRANPQWEIKTCESVQFPVQGNITHSENMIYIEHGETPTSYSVGLRLWLNSRKDCDKNCQQIGYLNLVPERTKPGGIFKLPIYERLDDVVNKFNQMIRYQPIPGRIITVETKKLKINLEKVNPEETKWYTSGSVQNRFLYTLRIFYEITEPTYEEIGFQDFIPSITDKGGVFRLPEYEMPCYTVNKASDWCSRQTEIRVFNVQTLDMKMERGKEIDMQKMDLIENSSSRTYYLRVLRIAYSKSVTNSKLYPTLSLPQLTCKSFIPVQLSSSVFMPEFESLQETKARVSAWIKATGAQVINAETSTVRVNFMVNRPRFLDDTTYTFSSKEENQYWIYVIRIYLDRHYPEPPEGTLPPVPVLPKSNCSIS